MKPDDGRRLHSIRSKSCATSTLTAPELGSRQALGTEPREERGLRVRRARRRRQRVPLAVHVEEHARRPAGIRASAAAAAAARPAMPMHACMHA